VVIDLATVQSNIVIFGLSPGLPDAQTIVERARHSGILLSALGPRTIRAVTHLDVSREACRRAAAVFAGLIVSSVKNA
jgi:threonine aldolase